MLGICHLVRDLRFCRRESRWTRSSPTYARILGSWTWTNCGEGSRLRRSLDAAGNSEGPFADSPTRHIDGSRSSLTMVSADEDFAPGSAPLMFISASVRHPLATQPPLVVESTDQDDCPPTPRTASREPNGAIQTPLAPLVYCVEITLLITRIDYGARLAKAIKASLRTSAVVPLRN